MGPGGGGNTLGIGGLSTHGRGPRSLGPVDEGGRRPALEALDPETTQVVSGLDKSVVARSSLAHTTLRDTEAEACILARVRRWRFPPPRGGGVAEAWCR